MTVTAPKCQERIHPTEYFNPEKYFDFENEDQRKWWQQTAPLLARIFRAAQYPVDHQYLYMTLYKTVIVPLMGPHPHKWDCFITYSGIPIEFSTNYQEHGPPTCRIGWEPVSHLSGTPSDRLNLETVNKAISLLTKLNLKSFDRRLFDLFMKNLVLSSKEAIGVNTEELPWPRLKNQVSLGLDLKGGEVTVKCYVYPALKSQLTGRSFRDLLDEAVGLGADNLMNCTDALNSVHEYLEGAGLYNQYSFIGFDFVDPSKSRLKVYNTVQEVTWPKLEGIWTLGGKFAENPLVKRGLDAAQELWRLITAETVPTARLAQPKAKKYLANSIQGKMGVGIYNYELVPGNPVPMPKWYFILHGQNDLVNAQAIVDFYRHLGWHEAADLFIPTFRSHL